MDPLAELLGESAAMEAVREQIRRLLTRRETGRRLPSILITGDTGTGKGLIARSIHRAGPRAAGPFVDVNCAAIPETLMEAELFGFERGAFTDARRAKPGLFQAAHRGTIFLDEVGLLPEALQAKLLKALEERAVRRLGATTADPVDVWIVSATNADLQAAVRQRAFREDLYHRLAVLTLRLPPLRERGRDVLILAERFLARVCADYALPPKRFAPDAEATLSAYSWPGNVRELGNVIERVALLADGDLVTADMLDLQTGPVEGRATVPPPAPVAVSLDHAMREHLLAALTQTRWNISRTAALLGISRNTLRGRIEKFGLRETGSARAAARPAARRSPPPAPSITPENRPAQVPSTVRWEQRRITLLRAALVVPAETDALSGTSRALDVLIDKVKVFGGRVEEISPAGLLASFGLEPVEEAPRRATHAALAMQKVADRARRDDPLSPRLRVGIHVAEVRIGQGNDFVKLDSDDERVHRATIAALLESAGADDIVVSATALPFLARQFELAPAPRAGLEMQAYRVTGHERKGFEVLGRVGAFVGRRHQLDLLDSRLGSAVGGHGQVVALVGEPGMGKSRLVWEFTRSRGSAVGLLLEASGVSHGRSAPFLPITDLLRRYFQIQEIDSVEQIATKVTMAVRRLDEGLLYSLPAIQALLDVPVDDPRWGKLDPPQRRQQTLDALKGILMRESRQRPLLLLFEDLHWIDTETAALLDTLIESIPAARMMLLVTYRPEFRHAWGGRSFYAQLSLEPLSTESAGDLLDALLGRDPGLGPVKSSLIQWAEGNPFFLEESGRTLVETGVLVGERGAYRLSKPVKHVEVPPTVEEMLAARLARLPSEERDLLDCAAVIGKDVPLPLLHAVTDLADLDVFSRMRQLQGAELLYETGSFPKVEYTFKHALTHEVTYRTIPPERRRDLHGRVVAALERLSPEAIQQLGYHAFRAERWSQALPYLRQAGIKAAAQAANREAVVCFEQALFALDHVAESRERIEQAVDLRFDLRTALLPLGEFAAMMSHLGTAQELAESLADQERLGRVHAFLADYFRQIGQYREAIETGRRGLAIALALGDLPLQVATQMYMGHAFHDLGDYRRASDLFRENVTAIAPPLRGKRLGLPYVASVHSRTWLVLCLAELGQFAEGAALAREALEIAESADEVATLISACYGLGRLHLRRADFPQAIPVLERGLELTRAWNIRLWSAVLAEDLGSAHVRSGRIHEGISLLGEAIELHRAMRGTAGQSRRLTSLGEAYLAAGRAEEAAALAERALELSRAHQERGNEAWALRLQGDLAARPGSAGLARSDAAYRDALALSRELGMRPLEAQCQLGLGRLQRMLGQRDVALENLAAALAAFGELEMELHRGQAQAELGALG
ncbi:MAG TPA: sigma 54-interacting transcriptional regulator [Methylomirabilota bacterium]|nr:sigma 54-interacting transcriptional regulator [Methylomirabilota bacterium]